MKEITVVSGKGGTGKTTVTAALASVAENVIFCDNDVDAADLHLIFQPKIIETHKFSSGCKAFINKDICTNCGLCTEHCRFNAIHYNESRQLEINPFQCEGCRLCERICPAKAIFSRENTNNFWFVSDSRFGDLVHAEMGPGEENSGKLVTQVRKKAKEIAKQKQLNFILNDGPPGVGCAAISSLSGTNVVLMVIEPTKSGLHDAKRLVELIESFGIETFAVINKYDINTEISDLIEDFLSEKKIPLLARIPFDKEMVESMIQGKTIIEYNSDSEISVLIKEIWSKLIA
ncbi:MAG: P-loop NTPase [Bacteroidales bacterium]|nr:P-loop NTPase [Bacteroidales bacterium]MBN2819939.1 P-loop NTPase [Bacteroidales bacterium]